MKSFRIALLTAVLILGAAFAEAAKVNKSVNIKVGNKTRKYRLYVPDKVKENTALVFCLHGTGGSSNNKQPAFDAIGEAGKQVTVVLKRLAGKKDEVFNKTVEVGENRAIDFSITDEWMEFNISFTKENADDNIQITGIEIHSNGNAVGINEVRSETTAKDDGIYNLSGVRTNGLTRGINIIKTRDGKPKKIYIQ